MDQVQIPPRLLALEKIIEKGKQTFIDVGLALVEIRDNRLYKTECKSFEEYCLKRWNWTRRRADQVVKTALAVQGVTQKVRSTLLISERAASELAKVPKNEQEKVLKQAAKNGAVTAGSVKKAAASNHRDVRGVDPYFYTSGTAPAAELGHDPIPDAEAGSLAEPERDIVRDKTGYEIPEHLHGLWDRSQEIQDILTAISKIKGTLERAQEAGDLMFVEVNFSGGIADLKNAYTNIQRAKPYAVCTSCQGKTSKNCALCGGKGLLSEFKWDRAVPRETKEFRAKAVK